LRENPHLACGRLKSKLIGIQDQNIPVRMKDRYGKFQEPCITRDIVSLVKRKKEAFVKAWRLGRHKTVVEYKENKNKFKQGVRRTKRDHKNYLAAGWGKVPRRFKNT